MSLPTDAAPRLEKDDRMTKLYACLGSGNCMKPWLAMTQLEQNFELNLLDVLKGEQKQDAFLAINPLGVVPFLMTSDGTGIGESNAMLWYLAEGTHLMPDTANDRAEALQWMFFEQSKLEPFISPARFFSHILPQERDAHAQEIAAWQDAAGPGLAHLNAHLANRKFILTQGYCVADIAVFGYVHVMHEAGIDIAPLSNITRWISDVTKTKNFSPLTQLGTAVQRAA